MKMVDCLFIVLEKGTTNNTNQGVVTNWLVADETASIYFSVWGDNTGSDTLSPNDIIHVKKAYATLFQGKSLLLYAGKYGSIEKIGEFNMLFTEHPNMSTIKWEFDPMHPNQPEKLVPVIPPQLQQNIQQALQFNANAHLHDKDKRVQYIDWF